MEITYKDIHKINFPVYKIPSSDLYITDGLLFCEDKILDDRNQIGTTLGVRRMQSPHPLLKLSKTYTDVQSMLRSMNKNFIDNKGYCFIYTKTRFVQIKYHKIQKIILKDSYSLLVLANVPFPVRVTKPPSKGIEWAGLYYLGKHPWLPYEYSESYKPVLKRKI